MIEIAIAAWPFVIGLVVIVAIRAMNAAARDLDDLDSRFRSPMTRPALPPAPREPLRTEGPYR